MYKIKTGNIYEYFSSDKKMFDFSNYSSKTRGVAIHEFVGLKSKIYSFLVKNSEHKKECVKKNVATISHNQFKNVLLNNKRVRHLVNSIQSKDHRVGTY